MAELNERKLRCDPLPDGDILISAGKTLRARISAQEARRFATFILSVVADGEKKASREMGSDVLREIAERERISVGDLIGPRRWKRVVEVRQSAMSEIARRCPHLSTPAIGRLFGDRDHTTVLHAFKAHARRMALAAE